MCQRRARSGGRFVSGDFHLLASSPATEAGIQTKRLNVFERAGAGVRVYQLLLAALTPPHSQYDADRLGSSLQLQASR